MTTVNKGGICRTFFTSDLQLHFYHKRICEFTDRPWVQEDNEANLIELWNNQVDSGDRVWHLGDFFFLNNNRRGIDKALEILEQLNGQIHCILGNHDSSKFFKTLLEESNKIVSVDRLVEMYLGSGKGRRKLVMCHYPMFTFNQSHRGAIMLHGHEHGRIQAPGKVIDVGLDGSRERLGWWKFWTEEDVLRYAEGLEANLPAGREDR